MNEPSNDEDRQARMRNAKARSQGRLAIALVIAACAIYLSWNLTDSDRQPEQPKTREEIIASHFSPWDGAHRDLVRRIKPQLHNPDSFEHVETRYTDQGQTVRVIMKYRAENGFGAIRVSYAAAHMDPDSGRIVSVDP